MSTELLGPDGRVRFGLFADAVEEVPYRECVLIDEWDRPLSRWRRYWRWNQFEFVGGLSEQLIFGCALANVRYAGSVFAYVYLPAHDRMYEFSTQRPLGWKVRLDARPEDGTSEFHCKGSSVRLSPGQRPGIRRIEVDTPHLRIAAELDENVPPLDPLRICTPAGPAGWVFARKTAGQTVRGSVWVDGQEFDLEAAGVVGHRDWSAGFMRRETFWNWGCLAARLPNGVLGLNISCGVNETSFTENCFWWNGRLEKLDTVSFEYERRDLMQPWTMRSFDGRCVLRFQPIARHRERTNLGVVALNFSQLIGRYEGLLRCAGGTEIRVDNAWGYAEWHYAKW